MTWKRHGKDIALGYACIIALVIKNTAIVITLVDDDILVVDVEDVDVVDN